MGVTGASGRLGHVVLSELTDAVDADDIVGIARKPARIDVPGIETRSGDYGSIESMVEAFDGIDTVVLVSAPVTTDIDRVELHGNVVDAAKQAGCAQDYVLPA